MNERDLRLNLLNTLLTTPHRDLAAIYPIHQEIIGQDPRFYVRLAAWYWDNGDVRDHREMFVVSLCLSKFEGHRAEGLALLRRLPPYEVARVVDFIKGKPARPAKVKKAEGEAGATTDTGTDASAGTSTSSVADALSVAAGRIARRLRRSNRKAATATVNGKAPDKANAAKSVPTGLGLNIPRSMRTEIEAYLRKRENDPRQFDAVVLHARGALKRLYAGLHIAPGTRAQQILFDDAPPQDSTLYALKQIAKAESPADQARLLAEHRVPYRVAVSVIKAMTPMTLAVLVDTMSPQEVINNVASLKKRGALDNPGIKALIEAKIEAAKDDKRVSAYKAKVAVEAAGIEGELADKLDEITETQIKAKGTIKRPTVLMIDKSSSMTVAIEVGRQLGAMISAICEADFYAYAFDTAPYRIEAESNSLADWEKALNGINAGGATSCGVVLEWMRRRKQAVEQIVMVTDEGDNTAPLFRAAYEDYARDMNAKPDVIFVKVGHASNQLERDCTEMGLAFRAWEFKGDYYSLPNLIPLLTRPSMLDLVMEVMEYPLPTQKKAKSEAGQSVEQSAVEETAEAVLVAA